MTETRVHLWRCRRCGKWSTAKRDPIAHKPERPHPDHPDDPYMWRAEWCGPFDRWTARLDDPNPRPDLPHVGQPVRGTEQDADDLHDRADRIPF